MARNPNEHYDWEQELRNLKSEEAKETIKQFLIDQATDPLTYLGGGAGLAGKIGKGLFAATLGAKSNDAKAMFFGGKYLPKRAIEAVEAAIKSGEAPEAVFKRSGYFKDPNGQWRKYVSDKDAQITGEGVFAVAGNKQTTLGKALQHDNLMRLDPSIRDLIFKGEKLPPGWNAQFDPKTDAISINQNKAFSDKALKSSTLHETQHYIQKQGQVPGGSYLRKGIPLEEAHGRYRNTPGEVEARVTQKLMDRNVQNDDNALEILRKAFEEEITNPLYYRDPFLSTAP